MRQTIDTLKSFYKGKTVLVTGHTGFKGSWLSLWLLRLGAKVHGYSLLPPTSPSHYALTGLGEAMEETIGDICDFSRLKGCVDLVKPDIAFHLAAEPLVLASYENPVQTFSVNVMGTVHFLEAMRSSSVRAAVLATTDKVYENKGRHIGYKEEDSLGASDPYSTSKAMAELAAMSYAKAFSSLAAATVRSGNVYGGGDFAQNRLIPDCMQAIFSDKAISLRNPESTRPWTYVLDSIYGYLLVGEKLFSSSCFESWNFGPQEQEAATCREVASLCIEAAGKGSIEIFSSSDAKKEMQYLQLCHEKATKNLHWRPLYSLKEGILETAHWYEKWHRLKKGSSYFKESAFTSIEAYEKALQQENFLAGV